MKDAIQSNLDFYTELKKDSFVSTRFKEPDYKEQLFSNIYNVKAIEENEYKTDAFSHHKKLVRNITFSRQMPDSIEGPLKDYLEKPSNKGNDCKTQERKRVEIGYMGMGSNSGEIDVYSNLFQSGIDRRRSRENPTQKNREFNLNSYGVLVDKISDAIRTNTRLGFDSRLDDSEFL